MSKYILVIDLPDDGSCEGCPLLHEDCCRETGHWFRVCNYDRPTNCPLIPVDRVIQGIDDLDDQGDFGSIRAIERCIEYLRMEMG